MFSKKAALPLIGLGCVAIAGSLVWRPKEHGPESGTSPDIQAVQPGELPNKSGGREKEDNAASVRGSAPEGRGAELAEQIMQGLKPDKNGQVSFQIGPELEDQIRALDEEQVKILVTLITRDQRQGNAIFQSGIAGSMLSCWLVTHLREGATVVDFTLGLLGALMPQNSAEAKSFTDGPLGDIAGMYPQDAAIFFSTHPSIVSGFQKPIQDDIRIELLKKMTRNPRDAFAQMEVVGVEDYRKAGVALGNNMVHGEGLQTSYAALLEKQQQMSGDPQRAADLRAAALEGFGQAFASSGPTDFVAGWMDRAKLSPQERQIYLEAVPLLPGTARVDEELAFLQVELSTEAIEKKFPAMIEKWQRKEPDGAEAWVSSLAASPWQEVAARSYVESSKDPERSSRVIGGLPDGPLKKELQAKLASKAAAPR